MPLHTKPRDNIETGLIYLDYSLDQPGSYQGGVASSDLAKEINWYMDWNANEMFVFSFVLALNDPGPFLCHSSICFVDTYPLLSVGFLPLLAARFVYSGSYAHVGFLARLQVITKYIHVVHGDRNPLAMGLDKYSLQFGGVAIDLHHCPVFSFLKSDLNGLTYACGHFQRDAVRSIVKIGLESISELSLNPAELLNLTLFRQSNPVSDDGFLSV